MNRALRLFAILSLIAALVFTVVDKATLNPPTLNPSNRALLLLAVLALLVALSVIPFVVYSTRNPNGAASQPLIDLGGQLLRKTSFLVAFGVAVAALTEAMWRRQRAWAWRLLLTLLVSAYGLILFTYIVYFHNVLAVLNRLPDWLLQQYVSANKVGNPAIPNSANVLGDAFIPALVALVALVYLLRRPRTNSASEDEKAPSQPPSVRQVAPISM